MDKMNHTPETFSNRSSNHIPQGLEGLAYNGTPVKGNRRGIQFSRRSGGSPNVGVGSPENSGVPTTPDRVSFTNEALRALVGDSAGMPKGLTEEQWDTFLRYAQIVDGLKNRAGATEDYNKSNQGDYDLAA